MASSFRVVTDSTVLHSSKVVLIEGMRPHRMVLRELRDEKKFVTHLEMLDISIERETLVACHDSYAEGHYFDWDEPDSHLPTREEAYNLAYKDFERRRPWV